MARYRTTVRTDRPPSDAFAFMADLRNFEHWDPGVRRATQVDGDGGGPTTTRHAASWSAPRARCSPRST